MSTTRGRNARIYIGGEAVGYAQNINTDVSADSDEGHSMDSNKPAFSDPGNLTFDWSAEFFSVGSAWLTKILAGTKFDMVFSPTGSPHTGEYETWTGCYLTKRGRKAGMTGALLENVAGKALDVIPSA